MISEFCPSILANSIQIVDEFSIFSLFFFAYLYKVVREIYITVSEFWFAGIPILSFGEGFQSPVVGGQGTLSKHEIILLELQDVFNYFS